MAYLSVLRQKEQWLVEITVVSSFIPAENHINPVFNFVLFWCKVCEWEEWEWRSGELKLPVASCRFEFELTFLHSPNGSS